jgi:hypothetical protein
MVRLEYVPIREYPEGKTFESDHDEKFHYDGDQYKQRLNKVVLDQSIVDQLIDRYIEYLIDGWVYTRHDGWIERKPDRTPLLPIIYDKAKGMIQEAFSRTELKPTELVVALHRLGKKPFQVDGLHTYFYIKSGVLRSDHVDLCVIYYTGDVKDTILKICKIYDD